MKTRYRRRRGGFTLLEVLLVLAILVILASAVTWQIVRMQKGAYRNAAKLQIAQYDQASQAFYVDVGQFPMQLGDLIQLPPDLPDPNKWKGPYLKGQLQTDPWGVQYTYEILEDGVRISSSGPNKIAGDDDDVSNI